MEIPDKNIKQIENKIRDLINFVQVKTQEELKPGEGKKVEDDAAKEIQAKLRELAKMVGTAEI
jgi:hypothetical protein